MPNGIEYIAVDSVCRYLGANLAHVYDYGRQRGFIIPRAAAEILIRLQSFLSLEELTANLPEFAFDECDTSVESCLAILLEYNLLISKESFCKQVLALNSRKNEVQSFAGLGISESATISKLCWITAERSDLLKRSLTGFAGNIKANKRQVTFAIFDDSRRDSSRQENAKILQTLKDDFGIPCAYSGFEEKSVFCKVLMSELIGSGIGRETIRFALFGYQEFSANYGANRNSLLLATGGELVCSLDDDIQCKLISDHREHSLTLSSDSDPTEYQIFRNQDEMFLSVKFSETDFVSDHEATLGQSLNKIISTLPPETEFNAVKANPRFVRSMLLGEDHIRITQNGIVGDSGMESYSTRYFLTLHGRSRDRLISSEENYQLKMNSRYLCRTVNSPVVCNNNKLMAYSIGIDNRSLLPPFMPVFRNEDGVFAAVFRVCFPHSNFCYLPTAVLHSPPDGRRTLFTPSCRSDLSVNTVLIGLVKMYRPNLDNDSPAARMKKLGKFILDLSSSSLADFELLLLEQRCEYLSEYHQYLENCLQYYQEQPGFWADHMRKQLQAIQENLVDTDLALPFELAGLENRLSGFKMMQQLLCDYGKLLLSWPEIFEAARTLCSSGRGLLRNL